ncbi:MAG TPA: hypothetical protein VFV87_12460 [Pirellulaceae bacterium]|nr:hypothetical protein [Pirellulaceae bacterium]
MKIKTADWVRSYSAGVWQVVREIPAHFEPRFSLQEPKQLYDGPLFVVKRLVNDKWKRAFEIEAVHHSLLRPLNKADAKELATITKNSDLLQAFAEFDRPLSSLLNIAFSLKRKTDIKKLQREISAALADELDAGVTSDRILEAIAASSFASACGAMPQSATIQCVNHDFEIRRRELIYRELRAFPF